jgi:hypothetical protein
MPFNVVINLAPDIPHVSFDTVKAIPKARTTVGLELFRHVDLRPNDPHQ